MTYVVWITQLYGSMILIVVGSLTAGLAVAYAGLARAIRLRVSSNEAAMIFGVLATGLAVALCGIVSKLVFDEHTGIERVIGNLFIWVGCIFSLGIGVRAARTVSGYPEYDQPHGTFAGTPRPSKRSA